MEDLLGLDLIDNKGVKYTLDQALINKTFVLLYFGANWSPACRLFTPKVIDFYDKCAKSGFYNSITTIFVSDDMNEQAFDKHFGRMSFLAIPF